VRGKFWIALAAIFAVVVLSGYISHPRTDNFWGRNVSLRQGLDLQGGVRLVYELDLSATEKDDENQAVESTRQVIERRVNSTGVVESLIQPGRIGERRTMIVELPGIQRVEEAIELIGRTAQLEFREAGQTQDEWLPTGLTGKQLSNASVAFDQTTNLPQVSLKFNGEGARLFSQVTARNIGRPVAIFLDGEIISAPTVQAEITTGEAVITGDFSIGEVRDLVTLLNAGALDVPIKLVEQRTVGATLGLESIKKSLVAGLLGLILVALYMVINYRLAGVVAVLALVGYTVVTISVFKVIPVTLTLAGIAGFILSIGMAVDANILIFERFREELRSGSSLKVALEDSFGRAWPSVRDSNAATLITCAILYFTTTGLVRGFALTLAIGVIVSLFSSITLSRAILRLCLKIRPLSGLLERV